jgi:hypothetical protein
MGIKFKKSVFMTFSVMVSQLASLVSYSCFVDPAFDDLDCSIPLKANITELKQVFYSPYENQQYALPTDTVPISDFRFNMEFEFEPINTAKNLGAPGYAYALDCVPVFDVKNISNIQVFLTDFFNELPPGRDISYLLLLPDGSQLSRFRDYSKMEQFLSLKFNFNLSNTRQLNSLVIIYLKNGEQLRLRSTSPYLNNEN